jgi:hypothetical protein
MPRRLKEPYIFCGADGMKLNGGIVDERRR